MLLGAALVGVAVLALWLWSERKSRDSDLDLARRISRLLSHPIAAPGEAGDPRHFLETRVRHAIRLLRESLPVTGAGIELWNAPGRPSFRALEGLSAEDWMAGTLSLRSEDETGNFRTGVLACAPLGLEVCAVGPREHPWGFLALAPATRRALARVRGLLPLVASQLASVCDAVWAAEHPNGHSTAARSPRDDREDPPEKRPMIIPGPPLGDGDRDEPRVLVVDGNPETCLHLARMLDGLGFRVSVALSAEEGCLLAREIRPAVVLLDLTLPARGGWDTLHALRFHGCAEKQPLVAIAGEDSRQRARELGVRAFLGAPVRREDLLAALGTAIHGVPRRVLCIDDSTDMLAIFSAWLHEIGIEPVLAEGWEQGAARLSEGRPDLILLDLRMPGTDGFGGLDALHSREDWRGIPVIVVSGTEVSRREADRLQPRVKAILRKEGNLRHALQTEVRRVLHEEPGSVARAARGQAGA